VSAAHVGGGTNEHAPQWRDRLYLVFTRKGAPLPDVEPRPLAWCEACGADVHALQSWKRPGRRREVPAAVRLRLPAVGVPARGGRAVRAPGRRRGRSRVEPGTVS
jgi:hypothetical protein